MFRLGKYVEGKSRPMKIRLRSQASAEEVMAGSWRLAGKDEYKRVWLRNDLNEEERAKLSQLWETAKEKNLTRTAEEEVKFYWKVKDMKLRKWYIRKENMREVRITVEEEEEY